MTFYTYFVSFIQGRCKMEIYYVYLTSFYLAFSLDADIILLYSITFSCHESMTEKTDNIKDICAEKIFCRNSKRIYDINDC